MTEYMHFYTINTDRIIICSYKVTRKENQNTRKESQTCPAAILAGPGDQKNNYMLILRHTQGKSELVFGNPMHQPAACCPHADVRHMAAHEGQAAPARSSHAGGPEWS